MKARWIAVSAALAICVLGAGYLWQAASARVNVLTDENAKLTADNGRLAAELSDATEKEKALEAESRQLRAARAMGNEPVPLQASETPAPDQPEKKGKGMAGFLSGMLKDPDMKKMIASQAATTLRQFYKDFLKSANLTPDETDQFFKILQDRQMAMMDAGASMMSGSGVDINGAQAATATANDALKSLLGPARYDQYQGYEKTLGDRMQVQQFNLQLAGDGYPLQADQSQALIQIMAQEKATLPTGAGAVNSPLGQGPAMSQASIDQYQQQLTSANQRIYNRAMSVLSPPQLTAFGEYQKSAVNTQIAGLKMAQRMMGGN
jgi:hypothetical protein